MAWLQVHQTLKDHRKLLEAADILEVTPPHMMGILISFWLWALDNAPSGTLGGISSRIIARAAQWEGDPDRLVEALTASKWLDEGENGLEIHDWYEYAGKLIDQRIAERERSKRRRSAQSSTAGRPPDDHRTTVGQSADDQQTAGGRVDQSRPEYTREEDIDPLPPKGEKQQPVPFEKIMQLYNEICVSFPKVLNIEGQRRKAVAARWKTYKSLEAFETLFRKTEASSFLKGHNDRNWMADFDWITKPTNMTKVLEGKYDDKGGDQSGVNRQHTGRDNAAPQLSGFHIAGDDETDE
jgi:hypothetical protein